MNHNHTIYIVCIICLHVRCVCLYVYSSLCVFVCISVCECFVFLSVQYMYVCAEMTACVDMSVSTHESSFCITLQICEGFRIQTW